MVNPRPDLRGPNKDRVMSVRLDEVETSLLITEAVWEDVAPSALLRQLGMDAVRRRAAQRTGGVAPAAPGTAGDDDGAVAPPAPEALSAPPKELAELRTEVNRSGVNINQNTRLGNLHKAFIITTVVTAEGSVEAELAALLKEEDPKTYVTLMKRAEKRAAARGVPRNRPAEKHKVIESLEVFKEMRDALLRVEKLLGGVRRAR